MPAGELEAAVSTNRNVIFFVTELTGRESFYGQGAGRYPTAYNAVADCSDILGGVMSFYTSLVRDVPVDNSAVSQILCALFRQRRFSRLGRERKVRRGHHNHARSRREKCTNGQQRQRRQTPEYS